ncbi:MAG: DUF2147 domain-containing protein [Treponema sp.]|jgi:uncharacterized protein (DUF2147 family)|nr:DUF2147 domain-containing protein [Treponema sp.]
MRKLLFVLCMVFLAGTAFAADPVAGFWLSVDEKTHKTTAGWEIYQTNGILFGKMLSVADFPPTSKAILCKSSYEGFPIRGDVREMPLAGTPWIFGLKRDGEGAWSRGSIINPEDGKIYKCKITFRKADGKKYKTDTLEMRGEIGLGIGRSQFWSRCTKEAASSVK